jgi:hypothetical protein
MKRNAVEIAGLAGKQRLIFRMQGLILCAGGKGFCRIQDPWRARSLDGMQWVLIGENHEADGHF